MKKRCAPDRARVVELLQYDPDTGHFTWRGGSHHTRRMGKIAGGIESRGYRQIRIDTVLFMAHRLAWLVAHNEWPEQDIDHINGVRTDNRIENLRVATRAQNIANARKIAKRATSQYRGVSWNARDRRWVAVHKFAGVARRLGNFHLEIEAAQAYDKELLRTHGERARLNFPNEKGPEQSPSPLTASSDHLSSAHLSAGDLRPFLRPSN